MADEGLSTSCPAPGPRLFTAVAALCIALSGCTDPEPQAARPDRKPVSHLVEVVTVAPEKVSTLQERTGSVLARRIVRIHNREEGRIEELPFFEGDRVRAGDLLVRIDDSLLKAELAKAEARTRQARLDLERIDNLIRKKAASDDELARTRTELDVALAEQQILETRIEHTRNTAPFDGIISQRLIEPGDVAARNSHLLTLFDPQSLVVEVAVSELTLPRLANGDPASVSFDALGGALIHGRVHRIHPDLDPVTRQGIVEISLDPLPDGIRAGQFARVKLKTAARPRLLVPFPALQRDRDGEFLFRVDPESKARQVKVRSGARIAGRIEILDGIADGDRIVTRGFLGLRADMTVRISAGGSSEVRGN